MNYKDLTKIGMTEGESKVYLALLELGSSSVGPIVKKSGVAYSNIYEILQRLINKGLASFILKSKTKYFQPSGPENLFGYLEKQEKELRAQKDILSSFIPKLKTLQKSRPEQEAEIFVGLKGLRSAYEKLAVEYKPGEWLFFYIHSEDYAKESDIFYNSIARHFKDPKIKMKGIGNKDYRKSKFIKKAKFIKIRYVDFPVPGNIDITHDKIMIVSWKPVPIAFLVRSQQIADSMREYFESVWKIAKK